MSVVDPRRAARGDQLVVGRLRPRVAQVLGDGVVEEVRVLHHEPDGFAQRVRASGRARRARRSGPRPRSRRRSAARASRSVVLPAPDGPTIATSSPGSMVRLTSRRIQAPGSRSSAPGRPSSSDVSDATSPAGWRNHTWSSSIAADRVDEIDRAGRSVTRAGKSRTSKTRSKLTSAVRTSDPGVGELGQRASRSGRRRSRTRRRSRSRSRWLITRLPTDVVHDRGADRGDEPEGDEEHALE